MPSTLQKTLITVSVASLCVLLHACAPLPGQPSNGSSASSAAVSAAPAGEGNAGSSAAAASAMQQRLLPSGALEIGSANAPVSMVLFTNHSCTYCRSFQENLLPRLIDDEVRTGILRISIMPFELRKYPASNDAAKALLCGARQGKGAAVHALLFSARPGTPGFDEGLTNIGVDKAQMTDCEKSEGVQATVNAQQSIAESLGITLIPTYFLNGEKHVGLPEYADLKGQVEEMKNEN